jgi:hypothetical protein
MKANFGPETPGTFIEGGSNPETAPPDATRQNNSLKRIHQNDEYESHTPDRRPPMHSDE